MIVVSDLNSYFRYTNPLDSPRNSETKVFPEKSIEVLQMISNESFTRTKSFLVVVPRTIFSNCIFWILINFHSKIWKGHFVYPPLPRQKILKYCIFLNDLQRIPCCLSWQFFAIPNNLDSRYFLMCNQYLSCCVGSFHLIVMILML